MKTVEKKETTRVERKLEGVVISDKMDKTVVVNVTRLKLHPKYKKRFKVSTKFKCHDEENQYKVGDIVVIKQVRPLSKDKRYVVVSKK
ncbi:MAG: 30S ribosomal protein S17 [Patescibacteria group bacterium]